MCWFLHFLCKNFMLNSNAQIIIYLPLAIKILNFQFKVKHIFYKSINLQHIFYSHLLIRGLICNLDGTYIYYIHILIWDIFSNFYGAYIYSHILIWGLFCFVISIGTYIYNHMLIYMVYFSSFSFVIYKRPIFILTN